MAWKEEKLVTAIIRSVAGTNCRARCGDQRVDLQIKQGTAVRLNDRLTRETNSRNQNTPVFRGSPCSPEALKRPSACTDLVEGFQNTPLPAIVQALLPDKRASASPFFSGVVGRPTNADSCPVTSASKPAAILLSRAAVNPATLSSRPASFNI
jgi:hypothetical protein